jgi:hypothetical protein
MADLRTIGSSAARLGRHELHFYVARPSSVETLYLKGARQRREYLRDKPVNSSFVSISRCDDRKRIDLNDNAKLYAELPIVDRSEQRKRARPISTSEMTGEDVIVTTDSVDTGERRRMGTYTAGRLAT